MDEQGDMINSIEIEEVLSIEKEILEEEERNEKGEEKEEGKEDMKESYENMEEKEVNEAEESQVHGIAGLQNTLEHWPDLASATRVRPSLPRKSKTMHRVVKEKPGNQGKKSNLNPSQ